LRPGADDQPRFASFARAPRPCAALRDGTTAVHSTFIVQSIYGAIQEYAGIDRTEWLDLA
jgi:hypothetical protein